MSSALIPKHDGSPEPRFRKQVILLSTMVAFFYVIYRAVWTFNLTSGYGIFASLFLFIGEVGGLINMLLYFLQVWDTSEPPEQPVLEGRTVDVFVPTYNEDPDLLRATLQACVDMDYPHTTYLCDDGGTEARLAHPENGPAAAARAEVLKALCAELGVVYLTRPDNRHAKAGNLNHAFSETEGEFIIIFDADHVPDRNFITRLIGYFADERVGFVQTPHAFYNFESFQARLIHDLRHYWEEGQLFYHVIQPGRNRWNAAIFAGSAAMFRRQALESVGFIATETITEDMHTGLRMHARGWKSLAISERMISGQAAQDVTTFHSQRLRWGEGNLSVMMYDNPLTMRGLSWGQRLCYFGTMFHWCGGIFKLGIYLTPVLLLFSGVPPVHPIFTWGLLLAMVAYLAVTTLGFKYVSNGYGSLWYSELFCMASFWTQCRATMRALFLRRFQRFVVTAKRGRQAKNIWPYVQPHVFLIIFSLAALFWAWSRVWFSLSEDFFRPVVGSCWAWFHLILAYLVIRRACWPDDNRYSVRHLVHLPVFWARASAEPDSSALLAITADLSDRGAALITYEPLNLGEELLLEIHAPSYHVTVEGVVRSATPLIEKTVAVGGSRIPEGFRYGVEFRNLDSAQVTLLNHITMHYAVPRLHRYYQAGHRSLPWSVLTFFERYFSHRRFAARREYHLPMCLNPEDPATTLLAATENISYTSTAVIVRSPLPPEHEVSFRLTTPLGELSGRARVMRNTPVILAAQTFFLAVLEFSHFDADGWDLLHDLLHPGMQKRLAPVVNPVRKPMPVPMNRPLAAAMALTLPLILAEFGLFYLSYSDEFFLRSIVYAKADPNSKQIEQILDVANATLRSSYPSTDKLSLLSRALMKVGEPTAERAAVIERLHPRDPENFGLRLALGYAYDFQQKHKDAEKQFATLLDELDQGKWPEAKRKEIELGTFHAAIHAGDLELGHKVFDRLIQLPDLPETGNNSRAEIRNSFAAALMNGDRAKDAAQLYQGVENLEDDNLKMLVYINSKLGDLTAAKRVARDLLLRNPNDPDAEGIMADVLQMEGNHRQAEDIFKRLLRGKPDDTRLAIQLAYCSLWSRNFPEALAKLEAVLNRVLDDPRLLREHPRAKNAYVDAAYGARKLENNERKMLGRLAKLAVDQKETDVTYLTRLGWVLHRVGARQECSKVLDLAAEQNPTDRKKRQQLAATCIASRLPELAQSVLPGAGKDMDVQLLVIEAYVSNGDFPAAIQACRLLVKDHPGKVEPQVRLADLLSWNKEYKESLDLLDRLAREDPRNKLYPIRIAEVTLWSGDIPGAVARFEALLKAERYQPELWWDYVAAAAGLKSLTPEQRDLAVYIAGQAVSGEHISPRVVKAFREVGRPLAQEAFLARLAWVLHWDPDQKERVKDLLDLALSRAGSEPESRRELARVLAGVDRPADAVKLLLVGPALEPEDRLVLANAYAAEGNFKDAAKQCGEILDQRPGDREAKILLADIRAWDQQYAESLELLDQLVKANPGDPELGRRQAYVLLWSGQPEAALRRFQALLEKNPNQPELRQGYLQAAGDDKIKELTPEQLKLARQLADQPIANERDNVQLLAQAAWVRSHRLKDPDGAWQLLKRAMELNSQDPAVLSRLGWILHQTEHKDESRQVLGQALALPSKPFPVRRELAGVLVGTEDFKNARPMLKGMLDERPDDRKLKVQLAQVTFWDGDTTDALKMVQKLLEEDFQEPELWLTFIDIAANLEDKFPREDLGLLRKIADNDSFASGEKQVVYLTRLAWVLHREGNKNGDQALEKRSAALLQRAKELLAQEDKPKPETKRYLGDVLTAVGRFEEALALVKDLPPEPGKETEWQAKLANLMLWSGDARGALDKVAALLKTNIDQPSLYAAFVNAAAGVRRNAQMTQEQVDLAAALAEKPIPDLPDPKELPVGERQAAYLLRLATVLAREDRKEPAGKLLDKARALNPKNPSVRRDMAGAYTAMRQMKEALDVLQELKQEGAADPKLLAEMAQITFWKGDTKEAMQLLEDRLSKDPRQPELWVTFIDAAASLNQGDISKSQLALVLQIAKEPPPDAAPDKVRYLARLAWVLHREKQEEQAAQVLAQAMALKPTDADSRRELARVLVATGDQARALTALELFKGLTLNLEDHFQLMVLYSAIRDWPRALQECDEVLHSKSTGKREEDYQTKARRWHADILLWSNNYAEAIKGYEALLVENFDQPEAQKLYEGLVEAASFLPSVTPRQAELLLRIKDRAADSKEPLYLARLAVVLYLHIDRQVLIPSHTVLVLGTAGSPLGAGPLLAASGWTAESARTSLARALWNRAMALQPKDDPTTLARLAWTAYRLGLSGRAAQLLNDAKSLKPNELAVRKELGDVMVATQRLQEALTWFEELAAAFPADTELPVRVAEVTVWAGAVDKRYYTIGLDRVYQLLTGGDLDKKKGLWHTFVDAASSAKQMKPEQIDLALELTNMPLPDTLRGVSAQVLYQSRLAWALYRETKEGRAISPALPTVVHVLLDRAMALQPRDPEVRRELAGVMMATQRFKDAQALFLGLAGEYPGDLELRTLLAEVDLWGDKEKEALERFEKLLGEGHRNWRIMGGFMAAAALMKTKLSSEQMALVLSLTEEAPPPDKAETLLFYSRLAWTLLFQGREAENNLWIDRANQMLDKAVALVPRGKRMEKPLDEDARGEETGIQARRELVSVLEAAGRFKEALELYQDLASRQTDPFKVDSLYAGLRRFDDAQNQIDSILEQHPKDLVAISWQTRLAGDRAIYVKELERLERFLKEDFRQPDLWRLFADSAGGVKTLSPNQVELALRIADQPLPPNDPRTSLTLARLSWALLRQGKQTSSAALQKRAADLAQQALDLNPRHPEACRALAAELAELGQGEAALDLLGRVSDPDLLTRVQRVFVLARAGRLNDAEAEARKLVQEHPALFEVRMLLADILGRNKKPVEANRIYQRLLEENKDLFELPERMARMSLWSKNFPEALQRYHELLAQDPQQHHLWAGYVDAAAAAFNSKENIDKFPAAQNRAILLRIYQAAVTGEKGIPQGGSPQGQQEQLDFFLRLAWVMHKIKEPDKEVTLLRRALDLAPNSREVKLQLAQALYAARRNEEAERFFRELLPPGR